MFDGRRIAGDVVKARLGELEYEQRIHRDRGAQRLAGEAVDPAALILGLILGYFMNDWMHPSPGQPARTAAPAAEVAPPSPPQHVPKKRNASNSRKQSD